MRRSAVSLALLAAAALAVDAASAKARPEAKVVDAFLDAWLGGRLEAAAELLAEDVTARDLTGRPMTGRAEVSKWLGRLAARHHRSDRGPLQVLEGGLVRWNSSESGDDFRALGLDALQATGEAMVRDGRIVTFAPRLASASLIRLREAQDGANKAAVRELVALGFGRGDPDVVDKLLAPDFADRTPWPGYSETRAGFAATLADLRRAFPDLSYAVEDLRADGDRVACLLTVRGTFSGTGEVMSRTATGRSFELAELRLFRLADGRIAEHWGARDRTALATQLGLDAPAAPPETAPAAAAGPTPSAPATTTTRTGAPKPAPAGPPKQP
jgi:hypothetical protein